RERPTTPASRRGCSALDLGATDAAAGVARRLTAVVLLLVDDDGLAEERIRVRILQVGAGGDDFERALAVLADRDVTEIAEVARVAARKRVRVAGGVEVAPGTRTVRSAAIAFLVNVRAVFAGRQIFECEHHFDAVRRLAERRLAAE